MSKKDYQLVANALLRTFRDFANPENYDFNAGVIAMVDSLAASFSPDNPR